MIQLFVTMLFGTTVVIGSPVPMEMVDMTQVFDNTTVYWPLNRKFEVHVVENHTKEGGYWLHTEEYSSAAHVGTHMDAPCHFSAKKWCIDEIPLDRLIAPAAVIDISDRAKKDRDTLLQVQDLQQWEAQTGQNLNGKVVLMRSGYGLLWPDRAAFTGTSKLDITKLHFPGVSREAAEWIVQNRQIYGLGVDSLSLDSGTSSGYWAHRTILPANIYGLECVANMEKLPVHGATLYVFPMKIGKASGAPVRIVAMFPKTARM